MSQQKLEALQKTQYLEIVFCLWEEGAESTHQEYPDLSVKELKDTVLFVRKLVKGGSAHSFGIHVAKMAGMPQTVILKAQKLLKKLEKDHCSEALNGLKSSKAGSSNKDEQAQHMQMSFFNLDDPLLEEIKEEILSLDINTLTPIEAMMKLNEIKRMLQKK